MTAYKYFGNGFVETNEVKFKKFGGEQNLTDEQALDIIKAGGGIVRSEDFVRIGFTVVEQSDRRERKGPAYIGRHAQAIKAMHALRVELENSKSVGAEGVTEQEISNGQSI